MNTAIEIVAALRRRRMKVSTADGFVSVEPNQLTEADVETILANKPAIIELLKSEAAGEANANVATPATPAALAGPNQTDNADAPAKHAKSGGRILTIVNPDGSEEPVFSNRSNQRTEKLDEPDPVDPREQPPPTAPTPAAPEVPVKGHTAEPDWTDWNALSIEDLLARARSHCKYWLNNCDDARRPQIRKMIHDLAQLIVRLKDQGDLNALRSQLISLRAQIEACISAQLDPKERTDNLKSGSLELQPPRNSDAQPPPNPAEPAAPEAPPLGRPDPIGPIPQDVAALQSLFRARLDFWWLKGHRTLRSSIAKRFWNSDSVSDELLAKGDYDSLRSTLLDLHRELDECVRDHLRYKEH